MNIGNIKIVFDSLLTCLLFFWRSEGVERESFGEKKKILFHGLMVLFSVGTVVVLCGQVTLWAT